MVVLECPWCGSSGDVELQNTEEGFYNVQVRCSNKRCLALRPNGLVTTKNQSMKKAEEEAIKRWNKRAPKRGI